MVIFREILTFTFKQFLLLSLVVMALSSVGQSQQQSNNSAKSFCTLSGTDLLAALDGSWTISQGAGTATGGPMTIPLPPPPPTSVSFKYDPGCQNLFVN